jgi:pimeloyl-ACP methyl ester carboxylesterase
MHVNSLDIHVVDEGAGEPVLLLHGFPDSSYLWRHQMEALIPAGYRVVVPDLRGFGQSDKPQEVEAYAIGAIVSDVEAILDQLGIEQAAVVGHDWGAVVAWSLASLAPERVARLVVMSVGHLATRRYATLEDREKAWYQLFFQFEDVAEAWLVQDDWKLFKEWVRGDGDMERYLADLSRPGALTAALNWYRANLRPRPPAPSPPTPPVRAPTLGMWSTGDHYLCEHRMIRSSEFVEGPWRYERIEGASHWLQLDAPERVNKLLLDFLGASG